MSSKSRWTIRSVLAATLLHGCAIAPVQQEVTGVTTADIVGNIRCETRDAIRGQLAKFLGRLKYDPTAQVLAARLADRRIPMREIDLRGLDMRWKKLIAEYKEFAIAYDFTLDGTVIVNLGGSTTGTDTFSRGSRTFPLTARVDRSRQNIQNFRQLDTFGDLLRNMRDDYCPDPHRNKPINYIYPIAGNIGIADQLQTFVSLYGLSNLGPGRENEKGPPIFTSRVIFTTEIEGTVKPVVTIAPVLGETTWGGDYGFTANRKDQHEVIIAFSAVRSDRDLTATEIDDFLKASDEYVSSRGGITAAEKTANDAVDQAVVRFEIGRQPGALFVNRPFISLF